MQAAATAIAIGTEKRCGDGRLVVMIDSSTCAQMLREEAENLGLKTLANPVAVVTIIDLERARNVQPCE